MSPSGREIVTNKPLTGAELAKLILADFERLLLNDGLLSPNLGYGRISYEITLVKHMDNFMLPTDHSFILSRKRNDSPIEDGPILKDPSPEAILDAQKVTRSIDSPNMERVRAGTPVPVEVRQQDGTMTIEHIHYPIPDDLGEGNVGVEDVTEDIRTRLGLPPDKIEMADISGEADPNMKWFPELRALAFLRRIAVAQERQAAALESLSHVAMHEAGLDRKQPKLVEIGTFDVDAANKLYQQAQEAKAAGIDL